MVTIIIKEDYWSMFDKYLMESGIQASYDIGYNFRYGRVRVYQVLDADYDKAYACWKRCASHELTF